MTTDDYIEKGLSQKRDDQLEVFLHQIAKEVETLAVSMSRLRLTNKDRQIVRRLRFTSARLKTYAGTPRATMKHVIRTYIESSLSIGVRNYINAVTNPTPKKWYEPLFYHHERTATAINESFEALSSKLRVLNTRI